jgi:hypothetical protein
MPPNCKTQSSILDIKWALKNIVMRENGSPILLIMGFSGRENGIELFNIRG